MEKTMTLYEAILYKKKCQDRLDHTPTQPSNVDLVCVVYKKSGQSNDGVTKDELEKNIQSTFDSRIALFENLKNVKAAINEANARITVTVAGKIYTIADAIVRSRMIDDEKGMYENMRRQYRSALNTIERYNIENLSPDVVAAYITKIFGDSKRNNDVIEDTKKKFIEDNEVILYDPLNINEYAEKKLEEISKFEEELHFALTKANCENTITFEVSE